MVVELVFCVGVYGLIYLVVWVVFFGFLEEDVLEGEFLVDESVEVVVFDDEIVVERGWVECGCVLLVVEFVKNVGREKGDLIFEVVFVVEEVIIVEVVIGYLFDLVGIDDGVGFWFEVVMVDEVMFWRNEYVVEDYDGEEGWLL